jgi:outer membrane protein insertion porin family
MNVTFKVGETPRVYVERIDITGNTTTRDKVIRREFRLNEGDAFNAIKVKRSQDRIQSLGYFQDKLEIKQTEGSAPDRVVLGVNVEEKPTGQLSLSGGYSSLERFVVQLAVAQNNFLGKGQTANAELDWSQYSKSAVVGFSDPYFLDKPILLGGQLFRRDYSSFNYIGNQRNTTYKQVSTGGALRFGFPINEYWSFAGRYTLSSDKISLNRTTFYTDKNNNGVLDKDECDPLKAGSYLCDELGTRLSSTIGYSVATDNTDGVHPTRGQRFLLSADFAGLGGDVKYARVQANGTKYRNLGRGWIFSLHAEGGYIRALQPSPGPFRDAVRLNDRFFGPQLRGFDIRGIGPRVQRIPYKTDGTLDLEQARLADALGGKAYYMGRLELEIPTSASVRNLGLRPSAFVDIGSLWDITEPQLNDVVAICSPKAGTTGLSNFTSPSPTCAQSYPINGQVYTPADPTQFNATPGFKDVFLGNSPRPRLSIGIGVNWVSPFGPLRIDLAKALLKQKGDDTKLFSFNVGTQF